MRLAEAVTPDLLIEAVVASLDETLAKIALIDEADHPVPYSPITPPRITWPHFDDDVALGDLLIPVHA